MAKKKKKNGERQRWDGTKGTRRDEGRGEGVEQCYRTERREGGEMASEMASDEVREREGESEGEGGTTFRRIASIRGTRHRVSHISHFILLISSAIRRILRLDIILYILVTASLKGVAVCIEVCN